MNPKGNHPEAPPQERAHKFQTPEEALKGTVGDAALRLFCPDLVHVSDDGSAA